MDGKMPKVGKNRKNFKYGGKRKKTDYWSGIRGGVRLKKWMLNEKIGSGKEFMGGQP